MQKQMEMGVASRYSVANFTAVVFPSRPNQYVSLISP
jgi:hypothetical protein